MHAWMRSSTSRKISSQIAVELLREMEDARGRVSRASFGGRYELLNQAPPGSQQSQPAAVLGAFSPRSPEDELDHDHLGYVCRGVVDVGGRPPGGVAAEPEGQSQSLV